MIILCVRKCVRVRKLVLLTNLFLCCHTNSLSEGFTSSDICLLTTMAALHTHSEQGRSVWLLRVGQQGLKT